MNIGNKYLFRNKEKMPRIQIKMESIKMVFVEWEEQQKKKQIIQVTV